MFTRILIANRGEIACRVIRTAQRMGIHCIAVYSDADAKAPHVKMADEAYHIGPSPARDSYLCADKILQIAQLSGAQAVHPGYGFLSENCEFAQACEAAGIVFIGPPSKAIDAMGSKSNAKQLMEAAGVPLVPGYHGQDQSYEKMAETATKIGYPVLLKAAAGGGGKGMRIVNKADELTTALAGAKREALSSFGDDKILIEKYLLTPRHIEIQVFSDTHDNHVFLWERDCSIQRRHQKIIEEAPAPHYSAALRQKMGQAAVACAKAIGYVGAGTVEFLLDSDGQFYFMEMNTRLQVEHPVTEMITGLDLVEWQLQVANGELLPLTQEQIALHGHAIEVRIYAEDPANDFLPSIGTITRLIQPATDNTVRIDTGVEEMSHISQYYDPMIAKLIVYGDDRQQAILRLQHALANYAIAGVQTNLDLLTRIIAEADYQQGNISTAFIPAHHEQLFDMQRMPADEIIIAAVLQQLLQQHQHLHQQAVKTHETGSPWFNHIPWQANLPATQTFEFYYGAHPIHAVVYFHDTHWQCQLNNQWYTIQGKLIADKLHFTVNEKQLTALVMQVSEQITIVTEQQRCILMLPTPKWQLADNSFNSGHLRAPMPGTITAVLVNPAQSVKQGDALMIMEAMKMEHTICAPTDGTVREICYRVGETVDEGAELVVVE
jgi:3-methylcrotonyl-CoA carboxylase alpha subunit